MPVLHLLPNSSKEASGHPEENSHSVTFVIITRNRPHMIKRLVKSILKAELSLFSLVLIDDSNSHGFLQTRNFLQSLLIPFKQLSSCQAGKLMEETLKKMKMDPEEKIFVRSCLGLNSPFLCYIERLPRLDDTKSKLAASSLLFAPYSPARNLGMCSALKFFDPDIVAFLDDDCLILYPDRLKDHILLIGKMLHKKRVEAVSGLYRAFSISPRPRKRIWEKVIDILRGMDAFLRKSFELKVSRFETMPPHMLGGTLILSKKVLHELPFDPYVARGEDHAYSLDLKRLLRRKQVAIRDNHFVVGHTRQRTTRKGEDVNGLRDIFRFIYIRAKTGFSFIPFFVLRWSLASLVKLFLNPSSFAQCKNELWALLFGAPRFAKENGSKFGQSIKAWGEFLGNWNIEE